MYKIAWNMFYDDKAKDIDKLEEYPSKIEAVRRFNGCWLSEVIARIWEDEEGVKIWSRDERADYGARLFRWEGMENDVWVEYAHPWKDKVYRFRSIKDLYLKMCQMHGVTPLEGYENMDLDEENVIHESFGCQGYFHMKTWFKGFPGEGEEAFFRTYVRYSDSINEQLKNLPQETTM